jgi:hypothetical protein
MGAAGLAYLVSARDMVMRKCMGGFMHEGSWKP